jgi:hypothetical protein
LEFQRQIKNREAEKSASFFVPNKISDKNRIDIQIALTKQETPLKYYVNKIIIKSAKNKQYISVRDIRR